MSREDIGAVGCAGTSAASRSTPGLICNPPSRNFLDQFANATTGAR
jgi:hypothetical protein